MSSGTIILIALVLGVTVLGFVASRWGSANLSNLDEWALGGRGFGTVVSWFLLGGDLYTAYTFIAVPALVYGKGALGFFAVAYATIAYPIALTILSRFYSIARERGYVTAADLVRDFFGDRWLEIAVAATGILASLPYIALQLDGMKTIFAQLGGPNNDGFIALVVAFVLLAAYTYTSGLRAPAMIAFVKDTLIYIAVIAAIIIIPARLGGWQHIFALSATALANKPHKPGTAAPALLLQPSQYLAYATWGLGSALSLFIYPHTITSTLAAKSRAVIRRNMALLPVYSLLLGFLALLGFCALAAGYTTKDNNNVVPMLITQFFPDWFAGVCKAAIVIGALVPAAIMAIGSANLVASNIANSFSVDRVQRSAQRTKLLTVAFCFVALLIVKFTNPEYAIYFQLVGGGWMMQIIPAFVLSMFTRWFHPKALLAGWACGMISATWMAVSTGFAPNITFTIDGVAITAFFALYALAINLIVASLLTLALKKAPNAAYQS